MNWIKNTIFSEKNVLNKALEKTKNIFISKIKKLIVGKSKIDNEVLDKIEETLISSDVGITTTLKIIKNIEKRVIKDKYLYVKDIYNILQEEILKLLSINNNFSIEKHLIDIKNNKIPYVILVIGVNGVGKTTSIGKLSYFFKKKGLKVLIGAADTFRDAAEDQLSIWANRAEVPLIKKKNLKSNPTSVVYDTLHYAIKNAIDIVLIDTAGRLHNKINLMNELYKIKNVMKKIISHSPNEVMLILDASIGQNAFEQAKQFITYTNANSIIITKLDGTAKGGVIIGICDQFNIPVKYIGIGENINDLQEFNKYNFVNSFFNFN